MYYIEGHQYHICLIDILLNYRQTHQQIHLKKKNPVLQNRKSKNGATNNQTVLKTST